MKDYYFIGIKGSGMSALAQVLHDLGNFVQGSDVDTSFFTEKPLIERGIRILTFNKNNISNIKPNSVVIASNAISNNHMEVVEARRRALTIIRYDEAVSQLVDRYISIGLSGVHGKTTTTGLLAHVIDALPNTHCSFIIGDGTGKGVKATYQYFIYESCEYRRSFLKYHPNYCIVTNIDFDHPDYFSGLDDVQHAFHEMIQQVKEYVVACGDDIKVREVCSTKQKVLYYGFQENNDLIAYGIVTKDQGTEFQCRYKGVELGKFFVPLFGNHNVLNALAVIGMMIVIKKDYLEQIKDAFKSFPGVKRRFQEYVWSSNIVIDDYAHHPTEIVATLQAVRAKYKDRKVVAIFQPHTYSRLKKFLPQFAEALSKADAIYILDIYGSEREPYSADVNISSQDLIQSIERAKKYRKDLMKKYHKSVLLFMGGAAVDKYIYKLIKR